MSAGQVQVLESLLAKVQKNREMPGLHLRLPHEAMQAALPSPPIAAPTASDPGFSQEPPSTKDFGERHDETSVVEQAPITLEPVMPTPRPVAAEQVAAELEPPTPVVDDQPVIEVAESAPEIVLDEASHDVFIEDTADEPDTFVHDVSPEAAAAAFSDEPQISDEPQASDQPQVQPPPTQARPDRDAQLEAVAAAQREPVTQAQPEPILDEETPDPITNPPPADARSTGLNTPQDGFAKRPPPPLPADNLASGSAAAGSAAAGSAAAGSRATGPTAMSEPFEAEAELDTPAPPDAAPVLAARHAIKPKIITPQVVRSAQVAEMIGEISAKTAADFGSILDASLSLSF